MSGPYVAGTTEPLLTEALCLLAGRVDPLFSDDAVDLIHLTSRGLPRSVNNIALQSLIDAFADEKSIVDESFTRLAITETHATD
ncbi:hypothetical protein OG698_00520 [Streptomyces sp. NBC_01003]|uniref:hypothetical protein n=1 Tax=Streptomyces sp. NBC_01003 TaxID=2903714 RepID=UPI003865E072|nr:hypothetical protein OG698_00520 [Streptomyces sp. NBC_01003]